MLEPQVLISGRDGKLHQQILILQTLPEQHNYSTILSKSKPQKKTNQSICFWGNFILFLNTSRNPWLPFLSFFFVYCHLPRQHFEC
jgi:hypothetical protein